MPVFEDIESFIEKYNLISDHILRVEVLLINIAHIFLPAENILQHPSYYENQAGCALNVIHVPLNWVVP
jgi:hypothetical protein